MAANQRSTSKDPKVLHIGVLVSIGLTPVESISARYFPSTLCTHSFPTITTITLDSTTQVHRLYSSQSLPIHCAQSSTLPTYPNLIHSEVVTLSSPRSITYYYYPKGSSLTPSYPLVTITRPPKRTQAEILTPPATPPLRYSSNVTPTLRSPSGPIAKMARGASLRNVNFAPEVNSYRAARDDELSVMEHFTKHAAKCPYCRDPYTAYRQDQPLCSRGVAYAKDVANYLYAKGGKPFSIIDRRNGEYVQVQIPAGCEVISLLVKAFDKGMKLESRRVVVDNIGRYETTERPVTASPSPVSPSRRERRYVRDDYDTVEIQPHSSRNERRERTTYRKERVEDRPRYERRERPKSMTYEGKGSLFPRDEEERRRRQQQYDLQPVVIVAKPGPRHTTRR